MKEKASWVGDGCLLMTQRRLPSPRSAQEQRRALQRPGLPLLQFCQHWARAAATTAAVPSPLLPLLLLSFLSFAALAFLCVSLMLSLIFTDINEPFCLSKTLKESKLFVLPGNILPLHLAPARLPDVCLNPQS